MLAAGLVYIELERAGSLFRHSSTFWQYGKQATALSFDIAENLECFTNLRLILAQGLC